jgi:hypothetical protein
MNQNTLKQFVGAGVLLTLVLVCLAPAGAQTFAGVLTQHNDVGRSGQNLDETILTPSNVSSTTFGKLWSFSVDGQMYSQPLYVPNVSIPGQGVHNVIYIETQNDSLYALDADGLQSTPLFQVSFINPAAGITAVPCKTDGNSDISCGVYPIYGINSTPVIDMTSNTMYLLTRTDNNGTYYQTLHAIDITTGAEKFGGPVNISGSVKGTGATSNHGVITFDPLKDVQRAGLLELNGVIYIGWAGAFHGWIMGYNATTLKQTAIFNTTPNANLGGVWAAGNGLVADADGNIYAAVGDALFDANSGGSDYGDSLLQLNADLSVEQYFTPMDQSCRQLNDLDLGSGGPMLIPGTDELLIEGKGGAPCDSDPVAARMYLLSTSALGGYSSTQDNSLEDVIGAPGGYWSSPAYWSGQNSSGQDVTFVYSSGVGANPGTGDYLKMFSVGSNGLLSSTPYAESAATFPAGMTPSISSNGATDGIAWVIERPEAIGVQPGFGAAVLYAYDAANTTSGTMNLLYDSAQALRGGVIRDRGGCANKFAVPTIANGKVYVATQNELDVFGLGVPTGPSVYFGNPCYTFAASAIGTAVHEPVSLVNNGTSALTISSITVTGNNAADFTETNTCPATLAVSKKCVITIGFTASVLGPEWANIMVTDNAVGSPHNIYVIGVGKSATSSVAANAVTAK